MAERSSNISDCIQQYTDGVSRDAYVLGYRAGYQDGIAARENAFLRDYSVGGKLDDPIEGMALSPRAYHCLERMGCRYVRDVVVCSVETIRRTRGMGKVTIAEVAQSLREYGVSGTDWNLVRV